MATALKKGKETKAHCSTCGGSRAHDVLKQEKTEWSDDEHPIWGGDQYDMLKCCGCGSVKLRHTEWFSENTDEHGRLEPSVSYYPPAIFRPEPRWFNELWVALPVSEHYVRELLKEIYVALQNDQRALAAMGIRGLLENVMVAKISDQGTFGAHLAEFEKQGYVSGRQRERLETILDAGHAAIHRLYRPSKEDLITLVDIAESIVESVYVHEHKVRKLKENIPLRAKRNKS